MPSISDLIKNKSSQDQVWLEQRRAERGSLSSMRDVALEEITSDPAQYQKYLALQSDNIGCSVGNVALTMFQLDGATKIGPISYWHEQGRYVREESMKSGAKVFVPPRNGQRRGYLMGDYYDVTQTTGRPLKEQTPLTSDSARMDNALASLLNYSPVALVENPELNVPARYNEANLTIIVNPVCDKAEVFAALATEITFARIHDKGRNTSFERENYKLDAESVGYMVCRRFGVDCPMPQARDVAQLYEGYEATDRSDALEQVRKTAKNIGDGVERGIQPRQQERNRRNYGTR